MKRNTADGLFTKPSTVLVSLKGTDISVDEEPDQS
jgi:hypothetical protein